MCPSWILHVAGPITRISSHRVFADVAECSKTSMGWFYGFKLHLAINEKGEVLDVALTPGNIEDRKPLRKFAERLEDLFRSHPTLRLVNSTDIGNGNMRHHELQEISDLPVLF